MKKSSDRSERGYTLVGVLFMTSLGLILGLGMLDTSQSYTKTRALVQTRSTYYYQVEETLNRTVSWLQTNSQYIVSAFEGPNFTANFDLGAPTPGDNEGEHFVVPTMVKMKGTNSSVMLSNNDFFGESAFPGLTHITDGSAFNPISEFANADLGAANARVVLVWARETAGNYEPIFRIDVVTGNNPDRGVHTFSYVYSTIVSSEGGTGFYGQDGLDLGSPNNVCTSYEYSHNGTAWSRGAPRANCRVASNGPVGVKSTVNGTIDTLLEDGISFNPPGGNATGGVCEGAGCHSYTLPIVPAWNTACPAGGPNQSINADTAIPAGCYQDVTIANKQILTLSDTDNPYYIKSFDFSGAQGNLDFGNIPPGEKVRIFVEQPSANYHLNGNRVINPTNAPHQVEIYYTGTEPLTLNGTSQISAVLYAPNAVVNVSGNFNYYGGIIAKELNVIGNASLNYDEALGSAPVLSDLNFALRKASQRYR